MSNYNDERLRILKMVEEGKISASEGISLLEALGIERKAPPAPAAPAAQPVIHLAAPANGDPVNHTISIPSGRPAGEAPSETGGFTPPKWFRVRVTDLMSGRSKVTVNIPFGLVDWGLRIGAQFSPELREMNMQEMVRILQENEAPGKIVDVTDDEDGEHVEIYIE
jgi:hypothetical protein